MPLIHVDSLDDERLDPYARLTEAQLRSKLEPEAQPSRAKRARQALQS